MADDESKKVYSVECVYDNVRVSRDGNMRLVFVIPASEAATAVQLLRAKGQPVTINILNKDGEKLQKLQALVHNLRFDSENESKVEFMVDGSTVMIPIASFAKLADSTVTLYFKIGSK